LTDPELTELDKAIIYKLGRQLGQSKTGQVPLPFFLKLFGPTSEHVKKRLKKELKPYIRTQKRQEKVVRFTDEGFKLALRVKDELDSQSTRRGKHSK